MSKYLKLTVTPIRVLFAGESSYIVGEATRSGDRRKVIVKGQLPEFHVWDTLDLECELNHHPKFGVTYCVKRVVSVRKSDVDRTNAPDIIMHLRSNMNRLEAQTAAMKILKDQRTKTTFLKFVDIVENEVPALRSLVSGAAVSPSDCLSHFWSMHLVVNPRKVWEALKNDLLIFCTRNEFRLPPLNFETARETWVDITKQQLPSNAHQTIDKYRELERACTQTNALSADIPMLAEYHGIQRLPNGRAILSCNYRMLAQLGAQVFEMMSKKNVELPYRKIKNHPFKLNGKQEMVLAATEQFRIVCIIGPAGSGKSYTTSSILYRFNGKHCVVLSRAARVGTEYVQSLGNIDGAPAHLRAETIDHVVYAARYNTKNSQRDAEQIRVVVVEEATMLTCHDAKDLLSAFPNASLFLLSGDDHQIGPVTNEPSFFNAFTRKYAHKPFVIKLDVVKRTDDASLLAAVNAIRERQYDELMKSLGASVKITPRPASIVEVAKSIDGTDVLILAQRHEEVDLFNREMFYNLFPLETEYSTVSYRVNETIRITENYDGKIYDNEPHLNTSSFENGSKYTILSITDYPVDGGAPQPVRATGESTKLPGRYHRIVGLSGDKQINLFDYKMFKRGYAMTVASSQGCETDHVLFYIQPNFTYLDCQQLYVAASRAIKTLEIIGELDDIRRILETDHVEYTADIEDMLPTFNAETMMRKAKKMKSDKKRGSSDKKRSMPDNGTGKRRKTSKK